MRIRIRFGFVWTGKFDLNTLRMDGNIFESGNKKLRILKISGYVWTELYSEEKTVWKFIGVFFAPFLKYFQHMN